MRPDFKNIDIKQQNLSDLSADTSSDSQAKKESKLWLTPEQIHVKQLYTSEDLLNMEHLDYAAGIPPYLRGPYSTMYVMGPWTIRQ